MIFLKGKKEKIRKVKNEDGQKVEKKVNKLWSGDWVFSAYNAYARRNAFTVYFKNEDGETQAVRYSIIASLVPSITYNFKF